MQQKALCNRQENPRQWLTVRTPALLGTTPQLPNGEKDSGVQSCLGKFREKIFRSPSGNFSS